MGAFGITGLWVLLGLALLAWVLVAAAGMWLATAVLLPIGLFLIYKALHDSQLFNKEFYYRAFRAIRKLIGRKNAVVKEAAPAG